MTNSESTSKALPRRHRALTRAEFEAQTRAEILRRARLLQLCATSDRFRAGQIRLCKADTKYFINNFVWTFDPRSDRKHYPLRLFPRQEEFVDFLDACKESQEWGLCEKSRDQGATWVMAGHAAKYFLFEPGFVARFGSMTEEKVDDGTTDSFVGKFRYIIEHLPAFLRPVDLEDKHLLMVNPGKGSVIKGESMNKGFGRSGRASITYMDEFAHVAKSTSVLASVSQTQRCAILTSTPQGKGNEFARIRFEKKIKTFTLHWSDNPLWSQERYNAEADLLEDWMVAQELDISYERSVGNRYYKAFQRQYHVAKEVIECDPSLPQYVFWDFGKAGAMAMLFIQEAPEGELQVWCDFEISDQDVDFCLPITRGLKPSTFELLKSKDRKNIERVLKKIPEDHVAIHGGDHAGTATTANSKRSCRDAIEAVFRKTDDNFRFHSTGKQQYDWRRKCVDKILKVRQNTEERWVSRLQVSPDCERFIECMNNASYDGTNPHTDNPKPKLDQFFHMVSAFEFFCINEHPLQGNTRGYREVTVR